MESRDVVFYESEAPVMPDNGAAVEEKTESPIHAAHFSRSRNHKPLYHSSRPTATQFL